MVYRGKPSAACGECRKRRSRCDQTIPACGQCIKAGRICSGYRNTVDLMFHDESNQVAHKNRGRISDRPKPQDLWHGSSKQVIQATAPAPIKLTDFILYQPLDDLGVSFFMSTYIKNDPAVSQLYYLPDFYKKVGYSHVGLQQSITAAGLAGYAKTTRRKDVVDTATKHYVAAIRGINAAVSQPETAVHDSTLMSIIMAAMFEVLIVPRLSGMENCAKHLDGAVAIALLKLKQENLTEVTQKLLTTLVQSTIINSWITSVHLPRNFARLTKRLKEQSGTEVDPNYVHSNFLDIVMELLLFREALQQGAYQHPIAIIRKAQAIDASLAKFAQTMPQRARFQAFRVSTQGIEQLTYDGYYHVYPQRFTGHLWNSVRSSRLRLHQVIRRQCHILLSSPIPENEEFLVAQKANSEANIVCFALEISASVPQLAGYLEQVQSHHKDTETTHPAQSPATSQQGGPVELPHFAKNACASLIESRSQFLYDHEAHRKNTEQAPKPSHMSVFYAECNDGDIKIDAPAQVAPLIDGPQPASVYHMLFQLYSLRSVPILPRPFKAWIRERIRWMEYHTEPEDLTRLRDMVSRRPGDGFPVEDEGSESSATSQYQSPTTDPTHTTETTDEPEHGNWHLVHNWVSVGWEYFGPHLDSSEWS